jgi:hypothetical protein
MVLNCFKKVTSIYIMIKTGDYKDYRKGKNFKVWYFSKFRKVRGLSYSLLDDCNVKFVADSKELFKDRLLK